MPQSGAAEGFHPRGARAAYAAGRPGGIAGRGRAWLSAAAAKSVPAAATRRFAAACRAKRRRPSKPAARPAQAAAVRWRIVRRARAAALGSMGEACCHAARRLREIRAAP